MLLHSLFDLPAIALCGIVLALFAAGLTKGILGIGLPTIAVPLLSMAVPLPKAVALLTIPIVATNVVQACSGEKVGPVFWWLLPILAGMVIGVFIGVCLLTGLSSLVLKPMVGSALILIALLMLLSPKLVCPPHMARVLSPVVGLAGGILGGLVGQAGPLVFIYLLSRGLSGARFVQYSSMYLVVASLVLTLALRQAAVINWSGLALSSLSILPILLGMRFGSGLRHRCPDALFRKLVLGLVILSGIYFVI